MLEPTLAPHLQPFNLNITLLGCVFLIMPLTFIIIVPFLGKLVKHLQNKLPIMIAGSYFMALTFFLLGPSPLFGFDRYQHLWPTLLYLGALGLFWAFTKVPSYEEYVSYTTRAYPDTDRESLMTALSSLMWFTMSIGELTSPVIADSILDAYGFPWAMTVAGFMCFFTGTMFLIAFMCSHVTCDVSRAMTEQEKATEKKALRASFNLSDNYNQKPIRVKDNRKLNMTQDNTCNMPLLRAYARPLNSIFRILNR